MKIQITETSQRIIEVDTENELLAVTIVESDYKAEKIVLDENDFVGKTIAVYPVPKRDYLLISTLDANMTTKLYSGDTESALYEALNLLNWTVTSNKCPVYHCDKCNKGIGKSDYTAGQGLCSDCISAIN